MSDDGKAFELPVLASVAGLLGGSFFVAGTIVPEVMPKSSPEDLEANCKRSVLFRAAEEAELVEVVSSEAIAYQANVTFTQVDVSDCLVSRAESSKRFDGLLDNVASGGLVVSLLVAVWVGGSFAKHRRALAHQAVLPPER